MRHASRLVSAASSVLLLAGLAACAPMNQPVAGPNYPSTSTTYPANTSYPAAYPNASYPNQNQGNYVEYGRVSNVEVIRAPQAQGSGLGAVIGGVAGAVVGHQIGGGTGRDVATVAGAVGGAVAGNAIEKSRNPAVADSFRVSVQLDNGSTRAFDVQSSGELRIGDRVRIQNGQLFRIL